MDHERLIDRLDEHRAVMVSLLRSFGPEEVLWRPANGKWCALEIVCHLVDEEVEDFRTRVFHVLDHPGTLPPGIDPTAWVTERGYMDRDFDERVRAWEQERVDSVARLRALKAPAWKNAYEHPKLGTQTAEHYLANWVAHDLLHFRQLTGLRFPLLQRDTGSKLDYAGTW
ncbi:MAG: DinB family protein [Flavobacteriales bacterium]|nr:DinB family protein [Flavobacteriales bacterium]